MASLEVRDFARGLSLERVASQRRRCRMLHCNKIDLDRCGINVKLKMLHCTMMADKVLIQFVTITSQASDGFEKPEAVLDFFFQAS